MWLSRKMLKIKKKNENENEKQKYYEQFGPTY